MTVLSVTIVAHWPGFKLEAALDVGSEPVALIGPNGSGKSSLLLAILGIRDPGLARIDLGDEVIVSTKQGLVRPTEERRFAYLPQDYGLFPHLTAQENVEFALACGETRLRPQRRLEARALLERFRISHLTARRPAQLSGGERQRVALARAIATRPRVLLLDEPMAALDVEARVEMRALLADYIQQLAIPTLFVTHDVADVDALAGQVAVMEAGNLITCAPRAEAIKATPFAAHLLAG